METSKTLIGQQLSDQTLFAVDTHANPLAPLAKDAEQMTLDTYGRGLEMPLAHYDQPTQSWRTSEDISLWGDYKLLENLPKSGMTRSGVLYPQPVWVRLIDETELSSWPTPTASDWKGRGPNSKQQGLPEVVKTRMGLWPTPTAHPDNSNLKGKFRNPTLGDAVRMWPTPTTQEVEHNNAQLTQTGRRKSKNGKTSHSLGLADAVRMWPTPTHGKLSGGTGGMQQIEAKYLAGEITSEERKAMRAGNGGKLNPMWVEWLMGFPFGWTDLKD